MPISTAKTPEARLLRHPLPSENQQWQVQQKGIPASRRMLLLANAFLISFLVLFVFSTNVIIPLPKARDKTMQLRAESLKKPVQASKRLSKRTKRKKQKKGKKKPASSSKAVDPDIDDPNFELPERYVETKKSKAKASSKSRRKDSFDKCDELCKRFRDYRISTLSTDGKEEQQQGLAPLSLTNLPPDPDKTIWKVHTKPFFNMIRLPKTLDPTIDEATKRVVLTRLERLLLTAGQVRYAHLFCLSTDWFTPDVLMPILNTLAGADQADDFRRLGNVGYTAWATVASQKAQHAFRVYLAEKAIAFFAAGKSKTSKNRDYRFDGEVEDVDEHFNKHISRSRSFFERLTKQEISERLLPKHDRKEIAALEMSFMRLQHESYSEKAADAWNTACITYFRFRMESHVRQVDIIVGADLDKPLPIHSGQQRKIALKMEKLSDWHLAWNAVRALPKTGEHRVQWFFGSNGTIKRMRVIEHLKGKSLEEPKQFPDASKKDSMHKRMKSQQVTPALTIIP